ncbi:MAG TPA: hypothetical protein VJ898_10580 [Natrialbaceae archaeon]|nr:hypothetical protein [Natrialbaceae archaeon]
MSIGQIRRKIGEEGGIDETAIHDVLRNDRRRSVIRALSTSVGTIELRTLASRIAEEETGASPPPKNARKSVYNSLHQTHLPKLDREGIIQYDRDRKVVSLREEAKDVRRYMEVTTPYGGSWATYYRTLATVSLFLVLLSLLDVPVLEALDPILLTSIGLGVVAVSTAYQLWRLRWLYLRTLF